MPNVSIITPIYIDILDKLTWLDEMLRSVLSQSMSDWEVILVDDSSPVLLGEVKWKYQDEKRFRWFKTAMNNGPARTRNVAAALAESEALLPLDSDDALATDVTLEHMYEKWLEDKSKIVYGNLQWLRLENGEFKRGKTYLLDPYTFKNAMDLRGVIPVTAMHSMDCHVAAGGWKAELDAGREDVEYWLAAGKAGFCGQKIDETTLLYRKHEQSRDHRLKNVTRREAEMTQKIKAMHNDVFNGRFPMGCCGGNTNTVQATPQINIAAMSPVGEIKMLPEGKYKDGDIVWVEYIGTKEGYFSIFGRGRRESYSIRAGLKFQALREDVEEIFRKRSREYRVGIPNPLQSQVQSGQPRIQEVKLEPQVFQAPAPELAIIERLDRKAAEARGVDLPIPEVALVGTRELTKDEIARGKELASELPVEISQVLTKAKMHNLGDLDLGAFEDILAIEGWTVQSLSEAEIDDLTGYKNIGNKRAQSIIDSAKKLINQT